MATLEDETQRFVGLDREPLTAIPRPNASLAASGMMTNAALFSTSTIILSLFAFTLGAISIGLGLTGVFSGRIILSGVAIGPTSSTSLTTINSNGPLQCGLQQTLVNGTYYGDGRTFTGNGFCMDLPSNFSLPIINPTNNFSCAPGFVQKGYVSNTGLYGLPYCERLPMGGVVIGTNDATSLAVLNVGTLTCSLGEALTDAMVLQDGRVEGGICSLLNPNVTTELICPPDETIIGQTRVSDGRSYGGMCAPLIGPNGTLPPINNGSTTCSGPATTITVPTTINAIGLSSGPYCVTVLTPNSTSGGGTSGVFDDLRLNIIETPGETTVFTYPNGTVQIGTPNTFIAPGTIQDTSGMIYSTNASVSAAGGNQATATVLSKSYNIITSVASGTGVSLPPAPTAGLRVVVVNTDGNVLNVYPALGGSIDSALPNTPVSLPVGAAVTYEAASGTQWYTVGPPVVGGSGITVTYAGGQTVVSVSGTGEVVSIAGTPNEIDASSAVGAVTLSTPAIFIAPGTIQDTAGMLYSTNASVVSTGTNQSTATVLLRSYNVVTVVASGTGVILPTTPTAGLRMVVVNRGANTLKVYPAAGAKIDGASSDTAVSLLSDAVATYEAASTTQWYTVDAPIIAGTGITVTYGDGLTMISAAAGSSVTSLAGTPNQITASGSTGAVTLSTPAIFIAPGTIQDTTGMIYSTNASIFGTGTTQATAAVLTTSYNVVISAAGGNNAVVLPSLPTPGLRVVLVNKAVVPIVVFPAGAGGGGSIDAAAINASVPLAVGASATYEAASSTQWYTVVPPIVSGSGITVTHSNGGTTVALNTLSANAHQIIIGQTSTTITLGTPLIFIAPGTIQDTSGMYYSTAATVSAAGSNATDATVLSSSYNVITTVAAGTGVLLPIPNIATAGLRVVIVNKGANTLNVYPAFPGDIDSFPAGAPVSLAVGATATYQAYTPTSYYTVDPPIVGGTGITVTYGNGQTQVSASSSVTSLTGTPNQVAASASTGAVTLSTPAIFIAPGTIQDTTGMVYSTNAAVLAAGSTQNGATVLAKSYNVITSVGSGTGVSLPSLPTAGYRVVVINKGGSTLAVYPAPAGGGGFIDGAAVNASVALAVGAAATYEAASSTQWYTVDAPLVGGSGISITYGNGQTQVSVSGTGEVVSIAGTPNQVAASASVGAVTLSTPAVFIAPGTIQDTTGMLYSTDAAVLAAGSSQSGATVLAKSYNIITSVGSGTGVSLPSLPTPGYRVVVVNKGGNSLAVYPAPAAGGGIIDGAATNASVALAVGATATYEAASSTQWYTVDPPLVGGSGISITYGNGQTQVSISGTGEVVSIAGTPNQIAASASVGAVTLSTPAVFIAPGTIQDTTGMIYSTSANVVAQGSSQSTATVLTTSYNILTTVANSSVGVVLPALPTPGYRVVLVNKGAAAVNVYAAANGGGGIIDSAATNASVTLAVGATATYEAASTTQWYTVNPPIVAGTGITVTYSNGQTQVAVTSGSSVTSLTGTPNQISASASTGAVTLSTPAVFIAPGTIQDTTGMIYSTTATIVAQGSTQSTATSLTTSYNVVTTVANTSVGVVLKASPAAGLRMVVTNTGASTLNVYPGANGAIDSAAVNASVTLATGASATYEAASTTQWYTVDAPIVAGSGITVTYSNGKTIVAAVGSATGVTSLTGTPNQVAVNQSTGDVTISTPAIFIAPGTIQDTSGMIYSTNAAVTAQGATQGTATPLTKSYNVITTVANSSVGVVLQTTPTAGYRVVIINKGAAQLNVYPALGATIDAAGSNTAVTLAVGASATYEAASTTQWYTVDAPIVAGSGITVTYSNGQTTVAASGGSGVTSLTGTTNQVSVNTSTGAVAVSTPSTFIAPGTIQDTSGLLYSTNAAVVAQGTNQGTATILTKSYNVITTVANTSVGVVLPVVTTSGLIAVVVNKGAATLNVYPASGAAIDTAATNTAVTIPVGTSATYEAASTTQWYTTVFPVVSSGFLCEGCTIYNTGTASQTFTTITGVGTTFVAGMVGGTILYATGEQDVITTFTSTTSIKAGISRSIASTTFTIYYGGFESVKGAVSMNTLTLPASGGIPKPITYSDIEGSNIATVTIGGAGSSVVNIVCRRFGTMVWVTTVAFNATLTAANSITITNIPSQYQPATFGWKIPVWVVSNSLAEMGTIRENSGTLVLERNPVSNFAAATGGFYGFSIAYPHA